MLIMKKLLLVGAALLSIAPYISAMNNNQQDDILSCPTSEISEAPSHPASGTSEITSHPNTAAPYISAMNQNPQNNIRSRPSTELPPLPSGPIVPLLPSYSPLPPPSYSIPERMTPEKEKEEAAALNNQWESKIVSAALNNTPFNVFKDSFAHFVKAYENYNMHSSEALYLNIQTLNIETQKIIDKIHNKLETITNELKNKTITEINNMINQNLDKNIKEDWDVIRKISLLSKNSLLSDYNLCLSKEGLDEKEIKKNFASLIDFASYINQPAMKPVYNWFIQNDIYSVLQNTSAFYRSQIYYSLPHLIVLWGKDEFPWKNIIESSLYSKEKGFDPLAIAVLWWHLTSDVEIIPENINQANQAIFSDLVKGLIDYMIDINYPQIDYFSTISFIDAGIHSLGRYYNLGEVSLRSFDGKESIIDMIQRKKQKVQSEEQNRILSQKCIERLTATEKGILKTIPFSPNLYKAIQQYTGYVNNASDEDLRNEVDRDLQNKALEEFKRLAENIQPKYVLLAINGVLDWIESYLNSDKALQTLYDMFSNYKAELGS